MCPWCQNLPRVRGHTFTLNSVRKSLNDDFNLNILEQFDTTTQLLG